MYMQRKFVLFGLIGLLSFANQVFAIHGLSLTVQGTNALLSWPSTGTENYLVQFRPDLTTSNVWSTLTNNYPAAVGTNRTTFIHAGAVSYPPPAGGGGPAEGPPPAPGGSSMAPPDGGSVSIFNTWIYEGREPYTWEKEQRPPYPWDPDVWIMRAEKQSFSPDGSTQSLTESGGGSNATMGFYRVFHVPGWPSGINGATVEGLTFARIDYADYVDRIVASEALLNGQPSEFAVRNTRTISGSTHEGIDFFFDRMTNGNYQLGLLTTIRLADSVNENNESDSTLTLTSKVVNVTINNSILFTKLGRLHYWEHSEV